MAMKRYQIKEFMQVLSASVEHAFNRFLGTRLQPIYEAQWAKQSSWGYRVRNTSYQLLANGTAYVCPLSSIRDPQQLRPLDPSLVDAHEAWLELYNAHMAEWPRIKRSLGSLAMKGESLQDWRDMFPQNIIQPLMDHPYMQVCDINGAVIPMPRERPDLLASASAPNFNGWSSQMVHMYADISDAVDTYIGYKFLQ